MNFEDLLSISTQDLFQLKTINLSFNEIEYITDDNFNILCNAIKFCKNLEELILSSNDLANLTKNNFQLLFNAINHLTNLKRLGLSFCHLRDITDNDNFTLLCKSLSAMSNLTELDISNNYLEYLPLSQFQELCTALQLCTNLTIIDLEGNDLTFSGLHFKILSQSLSEYKSLKQLNLSSNNSSVDNKELTELIEDSFSTFCVHIGECALLQKLELRYNDLYSINLAMLFESLNKCTDLQFIDLSDNELKVAAIDRLQLALTKLSNPNRSELIELDFSNNEFKEEEIKEITKLQQAGIGAKIITPINNNSSFSDKGTPPIRLKPRC